MKTRKTGKEKQSPDDGPTSHCGDSRKMAEMMKTFCSGDRDPADCCFAMMSTMGGCKARERKETRRTRKPAGGGKGA